MNRNNAPLGFAGHVNARVRGGGNPNAIPSLRELHQGIELNMYQDFYKEIRITLRKRELRRRKIKIEKRREMEDEFNWTVYVEEPKNSLVDEDGDLRRSRMRYHEEAIQEFREILPWLHPEVGILTVGNEERYTGSTDAMFKDIVNIMRNHGVRMVRTLNLYSRHPELINQFLLHIQVGSLKTLQINFGNDGQVKLAQLPHLQAHIPYLEDLTVVGNMVVPLQTVSHLQSVFSKIAPFNKRDIVEYKQNVLERRVIREHRLVVRHPFMEPLFEPENTFGEALDDHNESSAREEFEARGYYDNDTDILPDWIYRFRGSENEYLMVADNEGGEMVVQKQVMNLAQIGMF